MQLSIWILWLLLSYGLVIIVTQSVVARPFRNAVGRVSPWLQKMFTCAMCFGFHVGWALSFLGFAPARLLTAWPVPAAMAADAFVTSASCWTLYVVLSRLGANEL